MKKLIRGIVVAVACVAATSILPDLAYAQRGGRGGGGGGGRGGGGGGQVRSGAPVGRAVPRTTYRGGGYRGGYRGGGRQVVYTRGFYGRPLYWGGFGYGAWGGWNSWGPGWWGPGYAGSMWWPGWGWWGGPAMYAPPMAAWGVTSDARFLVQPRNTEVYVDGALAGVVDQYDGVFQSLRLAPGTHQITLYLDGHRRYQADVYVAPGSTLKLRHTMEPLAAGAPADERPSLPERRPADAAPEGVEDADGPPPPPAPPAPLPREPRLRERRPMAEGAAGTLVIRVQPADAEVFIDGQRWQAPPSDGPLEVRVPAGRIKVEVRKPGHAPFSTVIDVAPGERTPLNVSLPNRGAEI